MNTIRFTLSASIALALAFGVACDREPETPVESSTARSLAPAKPESAATPPGAPTAPGSAMPLMGRGPMFEQMRSSCPMTIDNAKVEVTDTEDGVALSFTTNAENVGELRERAQHMASMYEMHRGRGAMRWHHMRGATAGPPMGRGHMGMGRGHMGRGAGPMPAANASLENIDNGAKIVLTPTNADQLEQLREHVRLHQERMQSGECWMLQGHPNTDAAAQEK